MSKYGYYGGFKRPQNLGFQQIADPDSNAYQEIRRQRRIAQAKKEKFENPRFGSPLYQGSKKQSQWYHIIQNPQRFIAVVGIGGAALFWTITLWPRINTKETAQELEERDVLIRRAYSNVGDRWYARFLPFHDRWTQLKKEDILRERRQD